MSKPKVNLFALPSQTAILFWLITITLVGAIVVGTIDPRPIPVAWVPPVLILLSLRGFLQRPSRDIRQFKLVPAGDDFPILQKMIEEKSQQIHLKRIPHVLINENEDVLYTMGSFSRWYIVCGVQQAQSFEEWLLNPALSSPAQAKILHELYHFKTGDYWQLGYLAELFNTATNLMLWFMCFFTGWITLILLTITSVLQFSPDSILAYLPAETQLILKPVITSSFPSPKEIDEMRQKLETIDFAAVLSFVFVFSLGVIFLTAILRWFYHARFWRMREFYADSGMTQTIGTTASFWETVNLTSDLKERTVSSQKSWIDKIFNTLRKVQKQIGRFIGDDNFSPSFAERGNALSSPQTVFYDWKKTAWLLGSLTLFLEVSLVFLYVGKNATHLPTLVIVMATAYFLLPHILIGKSGWIKGLLIIFVVNSIRTVWLFFTLAFLWGSYFVQPDLLFFTFKYGIYFIAGYAGSAYQLELNLFDFLMQASVNNILQVLIILTIQMVSIFGLTFLFKRMMSWYAFFTTSERFNYTIFGLTFALLFVLLTVILPFTNLSLTSNWGLSFPEMNILMVLLGILVAIGTGTWFILQDQRYHHQCPNCKTKIVVSDLVGAICPSCDEPLYRWLLAIYEDK